MEMPKFVRFIGNSLNDVGGLKIGDIVEVLTCGASYPERLYVKTPQQSIYSGDSAGYPEKLEGHNFTYLGEREYELTKEEEMKLEHKFRVGDIVRGNDASRYAFTNKNMTEGVVTEVTPNNFFRVKVLKHTNEELIGNSFSGLDPKYFELVTNSAETVTPEPLYNITTDMKTFVNIEHNGNKGWSKCDLRYDDFDLETGIDIAMDRLEKIENPPVEKVLPKYVRYIGNGNTRGGLVKGDICRVLSGIIKGQSLYEDALFVACPKTTTYNNGNASNPSALKDHNFDYLYPHEYEIVNIHE